MLILKHNYIISHTVETVIFSSYKQSCQKKNHFFSHLLLFPQSENQKLFFFFFASLYLKVPLSTRIKIVELVKFVKTAFRCETGEKDTMLVFI